MPSKSKTNGSQRKKAVTKNKKVAEITPVVVTPVVATLAEVAPVVAAPVKQKGGSKHKGKKNVKSITTEQVTEAFTETVTETVTETPSGRRARSFKVLLPTSSQYEGRFTGLTPYQAANKALSKYYRETNKPKKEIQFSIRESTRGSKRSVYTYTGRREKLKVPVEYSIKDGRTIVKHYKNRLIKVKKAELAQMILAASATSATSATLVATASA